MTQLTYADRIQETAVNVGNDVVIGLLGAADARLRTFAEGGLDGKTVAYCIEHREAAEWEIGYGIYEAGGTTLTRAVVFCNSAGTQNLINFTFGFVDVWNDLPAEKMVSLDADSNHLTLPGDVTIHGSLGVDGAITAGGPITGSTIHGILEGPLEWSGIINTPTTLAGYGITDAWTQAEGDLRYVQIGAPIDWAVITNTPTTLAGYGITDAFTKTESDARYLQQGGTGFVVSVSGTAGRISVTGGQAAVVDIDAAYVGQPSITTLGTIASGVWNGTPVATAYGGTGFTTYGPGDLLHGLPSGALNRLPGPTTSVKQFLTSTGTGTAPNAPAWGTITAADVGSGTFPGTGPYTFATNVTIAGSNLTISPTPGSAAFLTLRSNVAPAQIVIVAATTSDRWRLYFSDGSAETGGNAGSSLFLEARDDTGTVIDRPIQVSRALGSGILLGSNSATTARTVGLYGPAGTNRTLEFRTGSSLFRWRLTANSTAEAGSNAGSDFQITALTDGNSLIDNPIAIVRAGGGAITLGGTTARPVNFTGTLTATGLATFNGGISITGTPTFTTPVPPTSGGTGLNTYVTGDMLYASAANTLARRAIGAAGQVLTVVSGVPTWQTPQVVDTLPWSAITGTPTTLAGYGITDAWTKDEADARYIQSVGESIPWTAIGGTPTTLAGYGITDAYTKTESDARFAPIAVPWASITGTPTTLAGYGITDAFTQAQADARYVQTVTGTAGRISVTGGLAPVVNIDTGYVGQASITTVGTITSGTWNSGIIGPMFGGTGVNGWQLGYLLHGTGPGITGLLPIGTANQVLTVVGGVPVWATATVSAANVTSGTFPGTYTFANSLVIGTDPGGTDRLRVGGNVTVGTAGGGSQTVTVNAVSSSSSALVLQSNGTSSWAIGRGWGDGTTNLNFHNTVLGSRALQILAATNTVLVGTTDPAPGGSAIFRVGGASTLGGNVFSTGGFFTGTTGAIVQANAPSGTASSYIQLINSMTNMLFGIEGTAGGNLLSGATAGAMVFGNATAGRNIELFTNNVRRVQITDGISTITTPTVVGTTAPGDYALRVYNSGTSSTPYIAYFYFAASSPNNKTSEFLRCADNIGVRCYIWSDGGISNYQANNTNLSDATLKDVGAVLDPAEWWDRLAAIEIRKFKYLDQTHADDNIGVIAQQVQSVAPELVDIAIPAQGRLPALLGVYTADLYHAHIAVTQELQRRVLTLEAKLNELMPTLS